MPLQKRHYSISWIYLFLQFVFGSNQKNKISEEHDSCLIKPIGVHLPVAISSNSLHLRASNSLLMALKKFAPRERYALFLGRGVIYA